MSILMIHSNFFCIFGRGIHEFELYLSSLYFHNYMVCFIKSQFTNGKNVFVCLNYLTIFICFFVPCTNLGIKECMLAFWQDHFNSFMDVSIKRILIHIFFEYLSKPTFFRSLCKNLCRAWISSTSQHPRRLILMFWLAVRVTILISLLLRWHTSNLSWKKTSY